MATSKALFSTGLALAKAAIEERVAAINVIFILIMDGWEFCMSGLFLVGRWLFLFDCIWIGRENHDYLYIFGRSFHTYSWKSNTTSVQKWHAYTKECAHKVQSGYMSKIDIDRSDRLMSLGSKTSDHIATGPDYHCQASHPCRTKVTIQKPGEPQLTEEGNDSSKVEGSDLVLLSS